MKKFVLYFLACMACMFVCSLGYAQSAASFIQSITGEVNQISVASIVRVVIGIIAAIYVGINLVKYFRAQGDSQNALLRVVIGVVIALILMAGIGAVFGVK